MAKFVLSCCLAVVLLVGAASCFEDSKVERREIGSANKSYDYFVFAQMWPQTTCWNENRQWTDSQDTCTRCRIPVDSWTIHGFWPSSRHGGHPSNCQGNAFQANALSSELREQLARKWPTYKNKVRLESFWGYEYKKHGSCALDNNSMDSVTKYFAKTLELLSKYDVGKALEKSNIRPGGQYNVREMAQALKRAFGKNTYLQCKTNPQTHEQYIVQAQVCFDKSFHLIDCSADKSRISNCSNKKDVIYPENLKSC
ncbi:hypothetical protein TSAR_003550 [Trichomalopsis sarcophagae]|uniref:Uncharacterized protein n=1 Tax=Trichomalopsis sarcophagae TaxID=543379 RepID=A0A232F0L0_9HYME|nr:hypothetical protein TSAR_003550 [Trichomalopsis sarcophagae]